MKPVQPDQAAEATEASRSDRSRGRVGIHRVMVVFGGPEPSPSVLEGLDLSEVRAVVAADRGLEHAEALGLSTDVIVGDLDSVDPETLARAQAAGLQVVAYSKDKDQSDLELALAAAASFEPDSITVVGSVRGRFDHVIGNLLVLADRSLHHLVVEARFDSTRVTIAAGGSERILRGGVGDVFSLFPIGGEASGVQIEGARWPLHDAVLSPTPAVGLSNEFVSGTAVVRVTVGAGVLAIIQSSGS